MAIELEQQPTPVFLPRGNPRSCVSVDLGQAADFSCVSIVQRVEGVHDFNSEIDRHTNTGRIPQKRAYRLNLVHLERIKLGTSYTDQVAYIKHLMARPPLDATTELLVDATGVGRPVADLFNAAGVTPIRIQITAGENSSPSGFSSYNVSKTELVSAIQAALDSGNLKFAARLREAGALKNELLDFAKKISESGRASYSARATAHDDIVMSIAQAVWWLRREWPEAVFGTYGQIRKS